jgi:indole-3-glycerol phosphate synthase
MTKLDDLVDAARQTVHERSRAVPIEDLHSRLEGRTEDRPFKEALVRPGLSVIAEFKRRSPSAGEIRPGAEVADMVSAYERGGAAALSVLTEDGGFGGSVEDLQEARSASGLPILRKDFVVDLYQLAEAAVYGADAVLLIVAALDPNDLATLYEEAHGLDLDTVVEVHDEADLEVALDLDVDVIGINNRNLRDFSVDTETTAALIIDVPAGKTVVAESGYTSREQVEELDRIGVDAVLIGEALMRSDDPERAVLSLTDAEMLTREHEIPGYPKDS